MLHETLNQYFGYKTFRPLQQEVIEHTLEGKDSVVIMPTGGGKSICFQLPALVKEGTCLVVSPLISLMKDQVESLKANGISAEFLNSSLSSSQQNDIVNRCYSGTLKLLYVSPEKLVNDISMFMDLNISMVAIDEAHCISQWGHDFRPEYTQMALIKRRLGHVPIMALTATADKVTRDDIAEQLELKNHQVFLGSFNRPNLSLAVKSNISKKDRIKQMVRFIKERDDESGIIYCLSRKNTEEMRDALKDAGIDAAAYHAGLSSDERNRVQEDFINDKQKIICATVAFGMGIDKPNVRWVMHNNLPKNIESFYQEIGRAGRDGLPSETLLYFNYGDLRILTDFASKGDMGPVYLEKLTRMHQYAEAQVCRRKILMSYFGEILEENCGNCDLCESPKELFDGSKVAQKAMSALLRLNQEVGMNMLVDVLRGSNKRELLEKGYHKIKTYGAGTEFSFFEWQGYLNQLINLGLIEIAYKDQFNLKVTPEGNLVLFGKKPLQLAKVERVDFSKSGPKKKAKPKSAEQSDRLLEVLKKLRTELARDEGVPPYIVFNDATLQEMAQTKPVFSADFESLSGVGAHKLTKYGPLFMKAIQDFVSTADSGKLKGKTYLRTHELYKQGLSVQQMALERNLSPTTIYSHLAHLIGQGMEIAVNEFVSVKEMERVKEVHSTIRNSAELKPYFEALNGEISYGTIRLALAVIER